LAKASGVALSAIYGLESGKGDPQLSTLESLAKALKVKIAVLIGEAPYKPHKKRGGRKHGAQ
jgi:transcriptional regulator with XRE-family HTH domain